MNTARLSRLFAPSGNCFDVAIDHGMFNEAPFLGGIENMAKSIQTVAAAAPDAIQLPPRHRENPAGHPRQEPPRFGFAHRYCQCLRHPAAAHTLLRSHRPPG